MKRFLFLSIALLLGVLVPLASAQNNYTRPCDTPKGQQLDFWVGEWTLTWPGGQGGAPEGQQGTGTNTISRILDDCIIYEQFHNDVTGLEGRSWSTYNPRTEQWEQTWVDSQGSYLTFSGGMRDGVMELYAPERTTRQGQPFQMRMIWTDVTEGALSWRYQRTIDGGETWADAWVISYTRKEE